MQYEIVRVLDEEFPIELAYWQANREDLVRKHPDVYLVIRGESVDRVLENREELLAAEEEELAHNPALVKFTQVAEPEIVYSPLVQAESDA